MKKYFYSDGVTTFGPFTLDELREKGITPNTQVWFQELGDWRAAGTVPELIELFPLSAPPLPPSQAGAPPAQPYIQRGRPPKNYLVESILVTLFCCLPFGIAGIVNAASVESKFNAGDVAGSHRASAEAKKWMQVGFWVGIGGTIIYAAFLVIAMLADK